jgi:4-amino-4-deoxy-L-arabinose transferase-like glycosyltransferase
MQENTVTIFCLLSVMMIQSWFGQQKLWKLILSGFYIVLAVLSKGAPGLFPLSVALIYVLATRRISMKKALNATLVLCSVVVLCFAVLLCFRESRESLSIYFFQRLVQRVNEVPTVDSRFFIIEQLLIEQSGQILLVAVILLFRKNRERALSNRRSAVFMLCVGLAGSLPLALTLVQRTFYYVPSLPFFALGLGLLIAPSVSEWVSWITSAWRRGLLVIGAAALLTALGLTASSFGKSGRDQDTLHDVYEIGKLIPSGSTVSIPHELWNRWELQCYFMRYFFISLEDGQERDYFLTDKDVGKVPAGFLPVNAPLQRYRFFRKGK